MNKLLAAAIAALIVSAPALVDKASMTAKADAGLRAAHSVEHTGDDESCRTRKTIERAMDGTLHVRKIQRCA